MNTDISWCLTGISVWSLMELNGVLMVSYWELIAISWITGLMGYTTNLIQYDIWMCLKNGGFTLSKSLFKCNNDDNHRWIEPFSGQIQAES